MSTEQMRKDFEEWYEGETGWEVDDAPDHDVTEALWQAWQASRAALEVELPEGDLVYSTATDTYGEDGCVMLPVDAVIRAISAAGITVKEG